MVSTRLKNIKSNWIISWGRNVLLFVQTYFAKTTVGPMEYFKAEALWAEAISRTHLQCLPVNVRERMETAWGFPPKKIGGRKSEYSPLKGQSMKITPPGVGTTYEFSHQTKEYQSWEWIPDVMLLQTLLSEKRSFNRCKRGHLLGIYGCFQK